ncbi:uncharacterized protein SCHCODRAFT_02665838 [Schizophyllum commune H4-8]|nr:uncharacterized protein SCHCODRAFT_02665838 [Schizophyllum commune H4-8]KAI5895504.1 hypothetical protein SCHCODRAFT_02665838 [Schizophyllum commune H4-8]
MSAAVVVLESLNQFVVNASSARDLVNDAAITNIKDQGAAIEYSINGAYFGLQGLELCGRAGKLVNKSPLDENVATRVLFAFGDYVQVYVGLMIALVDKHDVLVSSGSPLAPDGAIIAKEIADLQYELTNYQGWLNVLLPAHLTELANLMKQVNDAFAKAAAKYTK